MGIPIFFCVLRNVLEGIDSLLRICYNLFDKNFKKDE